MLLRDEWRRDHIRTFCGTRWEDVQSECICWGDMDCHKRLEGRSLSATACVSFQYISTSSWSEHVYFSGRAGVMLHLCEIIFDGKRNMSAAWGIKQNPCFVLHTNIKTFSSSGVVHHRFDLTIGYTKCHQYKHLCQWALRRPLARGHAWRFYW